MTIAMLMRNTLEAAKAAVMRRAEPLAGLGGLAAARLAVPALVRPAGRRLAGAADDGTAWEALTVIDVLLALLAAPGDRRPGASRSRRVARRSRSASRSSPARSAGSRSCSCASGSSIARPTASTLRYGAWVALVGAILAWVGSWLSMRDESHARRGRAGDAPAARAGLRPTASPSLALRSPTNALPRPGPPRRPPRPPRADPRGGRALRRRALQGARPHRDDRRARRPRRRRAHLPRDRRRERPARRRAAPVDAGRDGARVRSRRRAWAASASRARGPHDARPDRRRGAPAHQGRRPRRRRVLRVLPPAGRERRLQLLHLGRRRDARAATDGDLAGVPIAIKDLFCTEGIPSQAGSKILEGYRPPYTATSVRNLYGGRRHAAGQDQPGRVRDGLLDRELRLRPDAEPVGHHARARRLVRRQRGLGRRRHRAVERSAPTPAARSASPPRCAGSSASSRPTARSAATG